MLYTSSEFIASDNTVTVAPQLVEEDPLQSPTQKLIHRDMKTCEEIFALLVETVKANMAGENARLRLENEMFRKYILKQGLEIPQLSEQSSSPNPVSPDPDSFKYSLIAYLVDTLGKKIEFRESSDLYLPSLIY